MTAPWRRSRSTVPERLNAITPELIDDLEAALDRAEADDDGARDPPARRRAARSAPATTSAGAREAMARPRPASRGTRWPTTRMMSPLRRRLHAAVALAQARSIAQVHGYCVGGGTDFALCSDLIVCAEDCRIGYPPARVWGSPTTAMWIYRLGLERSKRLLLTGDPLDGRTRGRVGPRLRGAPGGRARRRRRWRSPGASRSCPPTSCTMMKLLVNQAFEQMGLHTTQLVGTLLDGAARHTPEGVAFTRAALEDVRGAVAERDARSATTARSAR